MEDKSAHSVELAAQIIRNHFRYEIIDTFVVGHSIAQGIDHRHIAFPVGLHEMRNSYQGVRIEGQRVEVFVADTAIDASHLLSFFVQSHVVDDIVLNHQISRESQGSSCLLGQIRMLKEGRIIASGSQDDRNAPYSPSSPSADCCSRGCRPPHFPEK